MYLFITPHSHQNHLRTAVPASFTLVTNDTAYNEAMNTMISTETEC